MLYALPGTRDLVLGRAEAFAMRDPVLHSVMDGLGYSLVLLRLLRQTCLRHRIVLHWLPQGR